MLGKRGMRKFLSKQIESKATQMAGSIEKEAFLKELKANWWFFVKKHSEVDTEVKKARERISKSGPFKKTFEVVGITDEDLKQIIQEIQKEKPEQEVVEAPKVGRNEPCPCGSGKKYKKCCLRKEIKIIETEMGSQMEGKEEEGSVN